MNSKEMASPSFVYASPMADDLLERVRHLRALLKMDDARIRTDTPGSGSDSGRSTPLAVRSTTETSEDNRHFSPPTREFSAARKAAQKNENERGGRSTPELIEETLHLLDQVTYVRISIDKLTWNEPPKFVLDEIKRRRSPRQRSSLFLEYTFPISTNGYLDKKMVVPARDVLSSVVHFNHRHVVLIRMMPILQLWSQCGLSIKLYSGKNPNHLLAKCNVPLCKVLVLPFSVDAEVPLETAGELARCGGKLKLCVQLGSRFQSFTERVEPMRNPTTAVNALSFVDPTAFATNVASAAAAKHVKKNANIPISDDDGAIFNPGRIDKPERKLNETFVKEKPIDDIQIQRNYFAPSTPTLDSDRSNFQRLLSPRVADTSALPPYYLTSSVEKYASADAILNHRFSPLSTKPLVEANGSSIFGRNLIDAGSNSDRLSSPQQEKSTHKSSSDAYVQTSFILPNLEKMTPQQEFLMSPFRLQNQERNSDVRDYGSARIERPITPDHGAGFWLRLTIHRARHLSLVKDPTKSENALSKPSCFWTYRSDSHTHRSPIIEDSINPTWEWSTRIFVPLDRKTLVLKLWHHGNNGRNQVWGFVAVVFPIVHPLMRGWYDIIDLSRTSTGQVEISFRFNLNDDREKEQTVSVENKNPSVDIDHIEDEDRQEFSFSKASQDLDFLEPKNCDHEPIEKGVNTSFKFNINTPEPPSHRSSCSSPFLFLTSRSFLTEKLRTNMDELSALTDHLKQACETPIRK